MRNQGTQAWRDNNLPFRVNLGGRLLNGSIYGRSPDDEYWLLRAPVQPGAEGYIRLYLPENTLTHCQNIALRIDLAHNQQFGWCGVFDNDRRTLRAIDADLVDLGLAPPSCTNAGAKAAVASLDFDRFKLNMEILGNFDDRSQGTQSNIDAGNWIEAQLGAAGYAVERYAFLSSGQPRDNIYATKVGSVFPDKMYIVSCHYDGMGGGGAVNDDASGCSLVLDAARALVGMQTAISVRFIFWNNEETRLEGSTAYVNERVGLQGIEDPPGAGLYPEPTWLGMIQHDQILFDLGLPPQPNQITGADIDIEYQAGACALQQPGAAAR